MLDQVTTCSRWADRERTDAVGVVPALQQVVPGGGLRRGSVVCVSGGGAASLGLALLAGASSAGSWCAVLGMPDFGVAAAVGMGVDTERLLLIDEPGARWGEALAMVVDGVDMVLASPPRHGYSSMRRLSAVVRRHGCVLVVVGAWENAWLRLRVVGQSWNGLGEGHGRLLSRRALVMAEDQGNGDGARRTWVWLPDTDGSVTAAEQAGSQPAPRGALSGYAMQA